MITGKARLAGVMGWPISHSLSPRLHGFWLKQYKIDGAYLPLAVKPEDTEAVLRTLPKMGFKGANLTLPHKEIAVDVMDQLSPRAEVIGAVNTVVVKDDGSLFGDNTDGFGFWENLIDPAFGWTQPKDKARPVVVLGAGGAARAVLVAFADAGYQSIKLLNRTQERAETLAADFANMKDIQIDCPAWDHRGAELTDASVLVNTTSLGMTGQGPLELDLNALPLDALVTDIVYAPLETALLRAAKARGNLTIDGIGMLLHQARPGFKAWFGEEPKVTAELRAYVLSARGA